jgi:hypothetical protein
MAASYQCQMKAYHQPGEENNQHQPAQRKQLESVAKAKMAGESQLAQLSAWRI